MMTNFNNSFTAEFSSELESIVKLKLTPHLKSFAALICEIWI